MAAGSKVGSAWYELRANDSNLKGDLSRATSTISASGAAAGTGFAQKFSGGLSTIKSGIATILPWVGALSAAFVATKIIGFFGEAAAAAKAQEVSIASLTAALHANDKAWDGNMASIDNVIRSRERLGFTDIEQRTALAGLVVMVKDHTAALAIERVAMDLARVKGIDLTTASNILGKAYNGNVTALKKLGIQVAVGTKGMEVLGIVQARVAGQAEAFAHTTEGAAAGAAAGFEQLKEDIGRKLLPVLMNLASWARDVLIPALIGVVDKISAWITENQALFKSLGDTFGFIATVVFGTIAEIVTRIGGAIDAIVAFYQASELLKQGHWDEAQLAISNAFQGIDRAIHGTQASAEQAALRIKLATGGIAITANDTAIAQHAASERMDAAMATAATGIEGSSKEIGVSLEAIPFAMREQVASLLVAAREGTNGLSTVLKDGTVVVGKDAADLAAKLPDALTAEKERALKQMRETLSGMVNILSQQEFTKLVEQQTTDLANSWSDASRKMSMYAYLSSDGVRAGLASNDTNVRQETVARVNTVLEQLGALVPKGTTIGENVPKGMKAGFDRNSALLQNTVIGAAAQAGYNLDFHTAADAQGYKGITAFAGAISRTAYVATAAAIVARTGAHAGLEMGDVPRQKGAAGGARYASGITSQWTPVHNASGGIANAAAGPLSTAGANAYSWGSTLSANFLAGMSSYYTAIRNASISLGGAASVGLYLRSPAKAGALSDPGVTGGWGRKVGEMFAVGMRQSAGSIRSASLALGAAAVPSLGSMPVSALNGVGGSGGGTTVNGGITININGYDKDPQALATTIATRLATNIRLRARSALG